MAKLNKMTIKEILNEVGTLVVPEQLLVIVNDLETFTLSLIESDIKLQELDIQSFLLSNSDNINKEKLVYVIASNLKTAIRENSNKVLDSFGQLSYKIMGEKYNKCLELLKGSKVEIPMFKQEDGLITIQQFNTLNYLLNDENKIDEELKARNIQAIENIEKEMLLENLLSFGSLDEFEEFICYNKENGPIFKYIITNNADKLVKAHIQKQKAEGKKPDDTEELEFFALLEQTRENIGKFPEKFDMDKLMLVSAYHVKNILDSSENVEMSADYEKICVDILKLANENIINRKAKISGNIKLKVHEDKKHIQYSVKNLEEDVSRIVGDKYFSKEALFEIREKLLSGELSVGDMKNRELIDLLKFTSNEKKKLIEVNPDNFDNLVLLNRLEKDEIKDAINHMENIKFEGVMVDYLYVKDNIEDSDVVKLYMNNNIDLAKIIDMDKMFDIQSEITVEQLMEYYSEMKEDGEKAKDFDRYSLLFRELKIKGKTPEEQNEVAEQIMEELYKTDSDYDKDLKKLYKSNLLPIRTLIDWNGEQMIYDLIKNNSLRPRDAKDLLMTGELNVAKAYNALRDSNLSDAEKMNFIFSSFDGVGKTQEQIQAQNDARMYLIQAINISEETINIEKSNTTHMPRAKGGAKAKRNQYVTDPVHRWQLFSEMDEDCVSDAYSDGTVIFTLPNVNNGTVIIEKLFKRTKDEVKINYGSATYIMSQEEFYNNRKNIEQNQSINRRALIQMQENGSADKLIHSSGWGKNLKKNLDISQENNYNEEKIKRIDNLIENIEKARELID